MTQCLKLYNCLIITGHLLRTLLISKSEEELTNVSLTIPLLYRTNDHILRNFESKGNSWTRMFELLAKSEDLPLSLFQDCILSLATLCDTIGMKYDVSDIHRRPKLQRWNGTQNIDQVLQFLPHTTTTTDVEASTKNFEVEGKVKITLDDGSSALVLKHVLTEGSPVFSAMFDGHFKETGSQTVVIRDLSKESLKVLAEQLLIPCQTETEHVNNYVSNLELSTLFELISLSDQFLLETVYERTLNTLLSCYICPFSAPRIYTEASKLSALSKPLAQLKGWDMDLTFVVLKYLLVGQMTFATRVGAFRKIFDSVPTPIVIGDIRALVEFYASKIPQNK